MAITVKELIEKLNQMPQDKPVKIATIDTDGGYMVRVEEYWECVVIESDLILYKGDF